MALKCRIPALKSGESRIPKNVLGTVYLSAAKRSVPPIELVLPQLRDGTRGLPLQSTVPLIELVPPTRGQMLKLSLDTWLCIAILRDWIIQISFSCIQSIQIPAFLHSFFISLDGGLLSQT